MDGNVTRASFPLATSETYHKDGRRIEQTEWHSVVMWRGLADVAAKYLVKGKLVYIEGKLRTRSYEDREGIRRYTTEVVADNFTLLGRKSDFDAPGGTGGAQTPGGQASKNEEEGSTPVDFKENDGDDGSLF